MFNPTKEQQTNLTLVDCFKRVKIVAGAGTSKSSSLRYMARELPDRNFLVLCFNSANAEESNHHPERTVNIFYATVHSIAYRELVDKKMREKLGSYLDFNDLAKLGLEKIVPKEHLIVVRRTILDLVLSFCRSDAKDIKVFSFTRLKYYFTYNKETVSSLYTNIDLPIETQHEISKVVQAYWELLIDKGHPSKITHDVYLKMYELHEYKINIFTDKTTYLRAKIDTIVLDEAQDSNPVTESIFNMQSHLKQVMVGDPMQQLYAWRGAGQAMDNFNRCYLGSLTQSFRFNSKIATIANTVLNKGGSDMVLIGSSTKETIETQAILCRTNVGVLEELLPYLGTTIKVYVSINLKDLFSKLTHLSQCRNDIKVSWPNKDFINIVDKKTLEGALEHTEGLDRYLRLGQELGKHGTIKEVRDMIDKTLVTKPEDAAIVISTVHASKGMEYDKVIISDDFIKGTKTKSEEDQVKDMWAREDLVCLLYVMITRARVELILPWYFTRDLLD